MNYWWQVGFSFVLGLLLASSIWFVVSQWSDWFGSNQLERNFNITTGLTNPYLECPGFAGTDAGLNRAQQEIEALIEAKKVNDESLKVSVYVRDLNNGPWIGVNEQERYMMASLTKVPVMMMVLKQQEKDSNLLQSQVLYDPSKLSPERINNNNVVKPEEVLVPGESYSVERLINNMIVHSDNEAFNLLLTLISPQDERLLEIGTGVNVTEAEYPARMSARNYAGFLRVLYNASYLNRELSEKALVWLANSRFDFGLRSGVPKDTLVANKYGNQNEYEMLELSRRSSTNLLMRQEYNYLHDCGVVYHPQNPFVMCVMTRSSEKSNVALSDLIAEITAMVYQHR